jgi:Tol biopolymer transport system component
MFVAVTSYAEQSGAPSGVFIVNMGVGTARRVTSLVPNSEIDWFADGKSIAFATRRNSRDDVVRVYISSGAVENLTGELTGNSWDPALGVGGAGLAVATGEGIAIFDHDMLRLVTIPSGLRASSPAWSPDGKAVAFVTSPDPIAVYG